MNFQRLVWSFVCVCKYYTKQVLLSKSIIYKNNNILIKKLIINKK